MDTEFEDHCWRAVVPADVLARYAPYARRTFVGAAPALLAIDLYELAYEGGARPLAELFPDFPSSCGEHAWAAIEPTRRLFEAARAVGLPIFYSTQDTSGPTGVRATQRRDVPAAPDRYRIRPEFAPQPDDTIVVKQRASAFFGTPLIAQLVRQGVRTAIVCGESTSGCVRATAVDAYSYGLHVVVVEECCFDRSPLSHAINLFDLHHKYADVLHVDEVVAHLLNANDAGRMLRPASRGDRPGDGDQPDEGT